MRVVLAQLRTARELAITQRRYPRLPMERQQLESGVNMRTQSENGFSLVEVMFALGVLLIGVLGAAAVLAAGMKNVESSPGDVIGTQKAAQAIETVFAARDSRKVRWSQIRNVNGLANDNGIFVDGPQPLKRAGPDGLVNTADDAQQNVESMTLPGKDQLLNTVDDETVTLSGYTREIRIRDVTNGNGNLRSVTVTIKYRLGSDVRTQILTTYISAYS
jgi:prepilin-type N-terminal cleavage/methylation domain-containing protein